MRYMMRTKYMQYTRDLFLVNNYTELCFLYRVTEKMIYKMLACSIISGMM